ncbi:hypothetical protein HMPREF1870_02532 [Bacteroidales bacterium KA00344]|nr:hypothetical protein HMPREF1870_02532 [Bacteroidales bacterium KA00344]
MLRLRLFHGWAEYKAYKLSDIYILRVDKKSKNIALFALDGRKTDAEKW